MPPSGHPGLREAIVRHGLPWGQASADDVIITNGTQQALDLVTAEFLRLGSRA